MLKRRSYVDRAAGEGGYVAIVTGLLMVVFIGLLAFTVDVGRWYFVGQLEQRAADAAALAGVASLPGDVPSALTTARKLAKANDFPDAVGTVVVSPTVDSTKPTQLRVTITQTVDNIFGPLLGRPQTTISRTAVADYAVPVPMGSPCNEFGNDPENDGQRSDNCDDAGQFWANVGSPNATKRSGDAFQNNVCTSGDDGCSGGTNTDYDSNGYVYTVTLSRSVSDLKIQLFDPAQVVVGDHCTQNLTGASSLTSAQAPPGSNPAVRYAKNDGPWCTGDTAINGGSGLIRTRFQVHEGGANAWDPLGWPVRSGCDRTFEPFSGDLSKALDHTSGATYQPDVAASFRQWVTLCSIPGTVGPGTYAIQVKTNGLGTDTLGGHNRFGIRAIGSGATDKDAISVAGFNKMAMYGNTPSGTSKFYLARVPSGARGQLLAIRLYDIGDGATSGSTISVIAPPDSGTSFTGCTGTGVSNGALSGCKISVSTAYNGKWQKISVPIPATYHCDDASPTGCWVRLWFYYGSVSTPADTTSWTASVGGDPVRLVQ